VEVEVAEETTFVMTLIRIQRVLGILLRVLPVGPEGDLPETAVAAEEAAAA
jgi:hypothetical protein